jgi:hypothetical protein
VVDIIDVLKAKFPDVPDIEHDIIGMFDLALEKGWLRHLS